MKHAGDQVSRQLPAHVDGIHPCPSPSITCPHRYSNDKATYLLGSRIQHPVYSVLPRCRFPPP